MTDYAEDQEMEVEALQSILMDDRHVVHQDGLQRLHLHLLVLRVVRHGSPAIGWLGYPARLQL
jgi:hypothetical protein